MIRRLAVVSRIQGIFCGFLGGVTTQTIRMSRSDLMANRFTFDRNSQRFRLAASFSDILEIAIIEDI
jgi:hypothetical protein